MPSSGSSLVEGLPGFIDAHAHWIGDREYYGLETPAEVIATIVGGDVVYCADTEVCGP